MIDCFTILIKQLEIMNKDQHKLQQASSIKSKTTLLIVDYITADSLGLSYETLPGNMPSTYNNFIAIWQNSDSIPWNQEPIAIQEISSNSPKGTINFPNLSITKNTYIIGYSVGPRLTTGQKFGNICSTSFIIDSNTSSINFSSSLKLVFVGTDSIAFNYNLPVGITPQSNLAWAGIWRSNNASYTNRPDATTPVSLNNESGTLTFDQFTVALGETYTIAFFMSGWKGFGQKNNQTAMACTLTFTNN